MSASRRIVHFPDVRYTVEATIDDGDPAWVDFVAYPNDSETPEQRDEQPFVRGHVKWDGCCDFFFEQDRGMHHACTREGLERVGALLARVHDLCGHMMARPDFKPRPLPEDAVEEQPAAPAGET